MVSFSGILPSSSSYHTFYSFSIYVSLKFVFEGLHSFSSLISEELKLSTSSLVTGSVLGAASWKQVSLKKINKKTIRKELQGQVSEEVHKQMHHPKWKIPDTRT